MGNRSEGRTLTRRTGRLPSRFSTRATDVTAGPSPLSLPACPPGRRRFGALPRWVFRAGRSRLGDSPWPTFPLGRSRLSWLSPRVFLRGRSGACRRWSSVRPGPACRGLRRCRSFPGGGGVAGGPWVGRLQSTPLVSRVLPRGWLEPGRRWSYVRPGPARRGLRRRQSFPVAVRREAPASAGSGRAVTVVCADRRRGPASCGRAPGGCSAPRRPRGRSRRCPVPAWAASADALPRGAGPQASRSSSRKRPLPKTPGGSRSEAAPLFRGAPTPPPEPPPALRSGAPAPSWTGTGTAWGRPGP